jgi:hypothetical protein
MLVMPVAASSPFELIIFISDPHAAALSLQGYLNYKKRST